MYLSMLEMLPSFSSDLLDLFVTQMSSPSLTRIVIHAMRACIDPAVQQN